MRWGREEKTPHEGANYFKLMFVGGSFGHMHTGRQHAALLEDKKQCTVYLWLSTPHVTTSCV